MRYKFLLPVIAVAALLITAAVALANTTLASHTGEVGATWTKHGSYPIGGAETVSSTGLLRPNTINPTVYYASGSPTNANYTVEADVIQKSSSATAYAGVAGRIDTAAQTMYLCIYDGASGSWVLQKKVAGVSTNLATSAATLTTGQAYDTQLSMNSTTISCKVDGSSIGSVTDSAVTAAGKSGVIMKATTNLDDTHNYQLDNFVATDL